MPTVPTSDAGKAIMQDTTIEIAINNLFHIGPKKAILFGKMIVINLLKSVKIIFDTLVIKNLIPDNAVKVMEE